MSLTSENVVVHRPKSFNSYSISRTEKFADLEIQCDDQAWKVHKIVVCDKSSVLNIALTNEWQVYGCFFSAILLSGIFS